MKIRKAVLGLLAAVLVVGALIQPAMAYFTCNSDAKGVVPIVLGKKTEIYEEFKDWVKSVTLENKKESVQAVYFRARAYVGSTYKLSIEEANGWKNGYDGWYYYKDPVSPGERTKALNIKILNVPVTVEEPTQFNVAIVYESVPVHYNEYGDPLPADWSIPFDVVTETYS